MNGGHGPNGSPIWPTLVFAVPHPSGGVQVFPLTSNGGHLGGMGVATHVSTVLLSSNCQFFSKREIGNTGVRKSLSGQATLIECTKATADGVALQLEKIANATKEVEANKLEVQLRLFIEQTKYQCESGWQLYKQGALAVVNARLAVEKQ